MAFVTQRTSRQGVRMCELQTHHITGHGVNITALSGAYLQLPHDRGNSPAYGSVDHQLGDLMRFVQSKVVMHTILITIVAASRHLNGDGARSRSVEADMCPCPAQQKEDVRNSSPKANIVLSMNGLHNAHGNTSFRRRWERGIMRLIRILIYFSWHRGIFPACAWWKWHRRPPAANCQA